MNKIKSSAQVVPLSRLHIQQFSTKRNRQLLRTRLTLTLPPHLLGSAVKPDLQVSSAPIPSKPLSQIPNTSSLPTRRSSIRKVKKKSVSSKPLTARIAQSTGSPLPIGCECKVHSRFQQISTPLDPPFFFFTIAENVITSRIVCLEDIRNIQSKT